MFFNLQIAVTQPTNTTVELFVRTHAGSDELYLSHVSLNCTLCCSFPLYIVKCVFQIASVVSRERGRQERESLQKIAAITKEGFLLKQQLIQEAKRGIEDKKVRLCSKACSLF